MIKLKPIKSIVLKHLHLYRYYSKAIIHEIAKERTMSLNPMNFLTG